MIPVPTGVRVWLATDCARWYLRDGYYRTSWPKILKLFRCTVARTPRSCARKFMLISALY
jgi:hypothetical protein